MTAINAKQKEKTAGYTFYVQFRGNHAIIILNEDTAPVGGSL